MTIEISPIIPNNATNYASLYANNLKLSWISTTTLGISAGQCRDSLNEIDMFLDEDVVLNGASNGLNGLDTGSLGASLPYFVYLIMDPTYRNVTGTLLSLSSTQPTFPNGNQPSGYGALRLIGYVFTNGSSQFKRFYQLGNGNQRRHVWYTPDNVLTTSSPATTFTSVAINLSSPELNICMVTLGVDYVPATAGNSVILIAGASAATVGPTVFGQVATVHIDDQVSLPSIGGVIQYKCSNASDALILNIQDFEYYI